MTRHSEYVDGRMDALEAARWRRHVERCASCGRYDRVVRRGGELVRDLPRVEPSPDFRPRFRHRLFHVRDELSARRAAPNGGTVTLLAVAVVVAAASWGTFIRSGPGGTSAGSGSADAAAVAERSATTEARSDRSSLGLGRRAWRRSFAESSVIAPPTPRSRRAAFIAGDVDLFSPVERLPRAAPTFTIAPSAINPVEAHRISLWQVRSSPFE